MASCTAGIRFQGLTLAGRPSKTPKSSDPSLSLFSKAAPPFIKLGTRGPSSRILCVGPVEVVNKEAAGIDFAAVGSTKTLLTQSLMHSVARREADEQIIAGLATDPRVVSDLVQHLLTGESPELRQHAAVLLLRINITDHWAGLPPQTKQLVKDSLVASITTERSPSVRRAIADLVGAVARRAVPAGDWPELMPFLFQCGQSPEEGHREVALIILSSLKVKTLRRHFSELEPLFLRCLRDETSARVRVAALKAVGASLGTSSMSFSDASLRGDGSFLGTSSVSFSDEVVRFREFVLCILSVARQFLAAREEEVAALAFPILVEFILEPVPDLLGDCVNSIVQFSLEVCTSDNLKASTRRQAIQIISWLAYSDSDALKKYKLLNPILQAMWPLLGQSGDEDDDLGPREAAAGVIEQLATKHPKQVFSHLLDLASASSQHADPMYREFSVGFLGEVATECPELMKVELEQVLNNIVLVALRDSEQGVRLAASNVLRVFPWKLQPEIRSQYRAVIPCILNALEDNESDREIMANLYHALADLLSNYLRKEEILPFLHPVMNKLLSAIQCSSLDLQESCLSAIGFVAVTTGVDFMPYADRVLELIKPFMVLTHDDDLLCRAEATALVGDVAWSLSMSEREMELTHTQLAPYIEAAISGFSLDHSRLRESTHGFFTDLVEFVYPGDGFVKYLPDVVPLAFSSCNLGDGSAAGGDDSDEGIAGGAEKAAATKALGIYAREAQSSYAPYLGQSLRIMIKQSAYFHEDVRREAIAGLRNILTAAEAVYENLDDGPEKTKEVLGTVMNIYIKAMKEDDSKKVVARVCTDIAGIVEDRGYAALEPYAPQILDSTVRLLQGKPACQHDDDPLNDEILKGAVSALSKLFPVDAPSTV